MHYASVSKDQESIDRAQTMAETARQYLLKRSKTRGLLKKYIDEREATRCQMDSMIEQAKLTMNQKIETAKDLMRSPSKRRVKKIRTKNPSQK